MPQQLLDHAHIGTALDEVCAETVAQGVRGNFHAQPGALTQLRQRISRRLPRQPAPQRVNKQRWPGVRPHPARPPARQPRIQRRHSRRSHGHDALLAALTAQQHEVGFAIHVIDIQAGDLGNARTGRVQKLHQRAVSQIRHVGGLIVGDGLDKPSDLINAERLRIPRGLLRRRHPLGDIHIQRALTHRELVEAPHGRQRPRHRGRGQRWPSRRLVSPRQIRQEL